MTLKKNSSIRNIYGLAVLVLVPSAVFAEPIVQEKTAFEYSDSLKNRCLGKNNKPENCLSQQENYIPETKVDEYIINSAKYATKFVPLLNQKERSENFTNILFKDGKKKLVNSGYNFANSTANTQIQKIPFFAQTSINLSGGTESDTSFSLNSLLKLRELAKDDEGDIKTLSFSQARFATATNAEGSTSNLGLGIRHRPNDFSMLGANAFWDYRMTSYSSAHSRLGLGGEYLWKDLEFRNNWYLAITDEKEVTFKGSSYKERVVDGWDVEIGYRLPNYPELAFYIRGFNWDYKNTQDNSGVEASINWQAKPNLGLEAWISNEISAASLASNSKLPGVDETFFGLRINITGNPIEYKQKDYKKNMITQMTQPVKRKYDVLLERSGGAFTNRAKGS